METSKYASLLSNKEFTELQTNKQRLKYILTKVKPIKEYREHICNKVDDYCANQRKNLQKSIALRNDAINCYHRSHYNSAINLLSQVSH